jgi:tripartite-type tricarboxylate transporter receptor subunit TctC
MKKIIASLLLVISSFANAMPINLLVGFPPGGGNYLVAQLIAESFDKLGHDTIIETKAGAGGIVGMNHCHENANNKNMICIVSQAQYVYGLDNPQIMKYDPEKISYVKMIAGSPLVLMANANNKKSVADIINDVTKPVDKKPVKFGTAGTGNKIMTLEFLRLVNAKNFVEAEYKGAGDAIKDLMGEHVDYIIAPYSVLVGKESQIRLVANLGSHFNNPQLKNVESLQKSVPKLPFNNATFGLVLGESASIDRVEFFYKLATDSMKDKALIDKLQTQGMFVFDSDLTSSDFRKRATTEIQEFRKWKSTITK